MQVMVYMTDDGVASAMTVITVAKASVPRH